jgi:hypothetical protein
MVLSGTVLSIFLSALGFELRTSQLPRVLLLFELLHQPFFVMGFFEIGLENYLPRLASNCDPPDLCLLSS